MVTLRFTEGKREMTTWYEPDEPHPFKGVPEADLPEAEWGCKWCGEYSDATNLHDDEIEVEAKPSREITATCGVCGFSSTDIPLVQNHNCDIELNGGHCEDYPCCGHERGDCNGRKYGSTESILAFENKLRSRGYEDYEIDDIFDRMH